MNKLKKKILIKIYHKMEYFGQWFAIKRMRLWRYLYEEDLK